MPLAQKKLHIISEFLAVLILVPYFIYLSKKVDTINASFLLSLAFLTLLIDGYLLLQWLKTE